MKNAHQHCFKLMMSLLKKNLIRSLINNLQKYLLFIKKKKSDTRCLQNRASILTSYPKEQTIFLTSVSKTFDSM